MKYSRHILPSRNETRWLRTFVRHWLLISTEIDEIIPFTWKFAWKRSNRSRCGSRTDAPNTNGCNKRTSRTSTKRARVAPKTRQKLGELSLLLSFSMSMGYILLQLSILFCSTSWPINLSHWFIVIFPY